MASSAQEFRQANRKELTLPSGRTVTLRKLTGEFLLVTQEFAEQVTQDTPGTLKPDTTVKKIPAKLQRQYIASLVREGVHAPRVAEPGVPPKEDEVEVADFGPDLDALVTGINEFNGEVLQMPFREAEGGEAPAPAGEGVRGEPELVEGCAAEGSAV